MAVYNGFARRGQPPTVAELAHTFEVPSQRVRESLEDLASARHLVLDEDENVVMAHPFSAVPLGFSVMGISTLWWGAGAWDSFAMAHLLDREPA